MSVDGMTLFGGPFDGQVLEEKFPPGHLLHGAIPGGVAFPDDDGTMHQYVLDDDKTRYSYAGPRPPEETP